MIADIRQRAGTVFHPCCTCRMGPDAATSVVDAQLRVHGVDGLRIIPGRGGAEYWTMRCVSCGGIHLDIVKPAEARKSDDAGDLRA